MTRQATERAVLGRVELDPGTGATRAGTMEIDARVIGTGLGLEPAQVQDLMQAEKISLLCERGTGEDQGCSRVTFYYARRRFRILIDSAGRIFEVA